MGWIGRLRARHRLENDVALWYHSDYCVASLRESARARNLELRRGEQIIEALSRDELLRSGDVRASPRATNEELARFHTAGYLESLRDRAVLAQIFSLDAEELEVEPLLEAQRRAVGGTIAAARAVAVRDVELAFNLGGGFHHAEPDRGSGFCAINDIGIAIAALRADGFSAPIAIVDLDFHQGNGNLVAFTNDLSILTFSMHGSVWTRHETKNSRELLLSAGTGDDAYFDLLAASLPPALEAHRPELIFYVAGTDVLKGDRLGTFALTPSGVLRRDLFVVECADKLDAGLVVTMGGGYSDQAWPATATFIASVLTGDERPRASKQSVRTKFDRVARELDPRDLQRDDAEANEPLLTTADLDDLIRGPDETRAHRVLDFYSEQGIGLAFERYGILAKIRERGYFDLTVEVDAKDPAHQIIRVRGRAGDAASPFLLAEIVVAKTTRQVPGADLRLLSIEWLLLQDPRAEFTLERPQLPGQEFPGLGIAEETLELLVQACKRLDLDGLIDKPANFHNALAARRGFHFLDPRDEGQFLARAEVLAPLALADASRQKVQLESGEVVPWIPADHALALKPPLRAYFESPLYLEARDREKARLISLGLHFSQND